MCTQEQREDTKLALKQTKLKEAILTQAGHLRKEAESEMKNENALKEKDRILLEEKRNRMDEQTKLF